MSQEGQSCWFIVFNVSQLKNVSLSTKGYINASQRLWSVGGMLASEQGKEHKMRGLKQWYSGNIIRL